MFSPTENLPDLTSGAGIATKLATRLRFASTSKVYSAVVDKEDIFAYFDRRGEDEVVVDYNKLKNIQIASKPLDKTDTLAKLME